MARTGNAERLRRYWTSGKGAASIRWGTSGDFRRCVRKTRKYMANPQGYCAKLHKRATGQWPGRGRKH